ncbi:MAG: hypothetical protein ACRD3T_09970, partial [Terriglobia bacterium]
AYDRYRRKAALSDDIFNRESITDRRINIGKLLIPGVIKSVFNGSHMTNRLPQKYSCSGCITAL